MFSAADTIRSKRDGRVLDAPAIQAFIAAVADGQVSDAQLGAFLMAVYLNGMDREEQATLTLAMRDSGRVLAFEDLDGPVLDKHSTGGVGDFVSLLLGPLIAACGGYVPMISGRGLGHTGGTLDKLESIPGYRVNLQPGELRDAVRDIGVAIVGQGPDLAPADQRLYAARDVTATVSCTPLIVSSILSKKLAEGLDALVMDIKFGNGAVMTESADARFLGQQICNVAAAAGLPCTALMTDMGRPLAWSAGNALEVREAVDFLTGARRHPRMTEVTLALCSELLVNSGLAPDAAAARQALHAALDSGEAAERFARMVERQGGPADLLQDPDRHLVTAPVKRVVEAGRTGFVGEMDLRGLGRIVGGLGGGRHRPDDTIDSRVGLSGLLPTGQSVDTGQALVTIHAASESDANEAEAAFRNAVSLADEPPPDKPVVHDIIQAE